MSDQENLDIGRVVSLIMENPELIEQISNLAKSACYAPFLSLALGFVRERSNHFTSALVKVPVAIKRMA